MGERLILRAAKDWHLENPDGPKLQIDVLSPGATVETERMRTSYPPLDLACELRPHDVAPEPLSFVETLDRIHGARSSSRRSLAWTTRAPP